MSRRLDVLVSETFGVSREFAKEAILAEKCMVDGRILLKPGAKVELDAKITLNADLPRFVSRGGEKLAKAIEVFSLDLRDLQCMDVGAATGGFTDCMLQNGAKSVFAVENGMGQMHPKLASDVRVILRESTDIRNFNIRELPFVPEFISVDLSFISIIHALPKISEILLSGGQAVLLIKPQFEVGPGVVDKRGVVRRTDEHCKIIENVCMASQKQGLAPIRLDFSPIVGQNGNIEYLLLVEKNEGTQSIYEMISKVVEQGFLELRT